MSYVSSLQAWEETLPQSHVFASVFSFSTEAQDEMLTKLRANTLASETQCEWLDDKRLNIVCANDATVAALFDVYAEYINTEQGGAREAYEVSKLDRMIDTMVKTSENDEAASEESLHQEDDIQETHTLLPVLVSHEMVSKVWCLEHQDGLESQLPKRLLKLSIFEAIGKLTNCRIITGIDTAVLTVKGDNDQDVDQAIEKFGKLAKAFSLLSKPARIHDFAIQEVEVDVSFQIRRLNDVETIDQRSTTIISPKSFPSAESSDFGVVLMIKKGKGIITISRTGVTSGATMIPLDKQRWQGINILHHGNQAIDFASRDTKSDHTQSQTESFQSPLPLQTQILANAATNPEHAAQFVEKWVETTAEAKYSAFDPRKEPLNEEPLKEEPRNEEPLAELDVMEASDNKDSTKGSLVKSRYAKIRRANAAQGDDVEVEDGDDVSFYNPLEPQSASSEGARSSLPTSYAQSLLPDIDRAKTKECLVDIGVENSKPRVHQPVNLSPQLPSLSGIRKPTPLALRSATDRTVQDLLTEEDPNIDYPVTVPPPAITSPYMPPPTSSRASNASDFPPKSLVPGWMKQNPTTAASSTHKKGSLLIDDAEPTIAQPIDYLAAAKRGTLRTRGAPRARGTARGRVYKGVAPPYERLQSSSEIQSRQVHRTMNQKMARPPVAQPSQIEAFKSATVQLLQSANTFRGIDTIEVEIGRILVKTGQGAIGRTFFSKDWSSVFDDRTGNKPETVFINMLPFSDSDIRHVAGLRQPNGRQMFVDNPFKSTVKFRFSCGTKLGDEEIILEAGAFGNVRVLSSDHLVGAVNWHFPKRQWDARLAVKVTEEVQDYQNAVEAVTRTLSVVPSTDGRTAKLCAELGNTGLIFKSASIHREMKFRCDIYPDIVMSCTEVQYLGPTKERHRFWNSIRDVETARENGDLWWGIKLQSVEADKKLHSSKDLALGEEADWKAEDVVQEGAVKQLHRLASDIVTQIDDIGITVDTTAKTASIAKEIAAKKEAVKEVDTFW